MSFAPPASVIQSLKDVLGDGGWSQDPARLAPKLKEWRDRWTGETPLLALPSTPDQVARVVAICAQAGVAITPQGGNTGLVGGQIPQGEILLSTERLNRVRDLDLADAVIVVEAGVTLARVREEAAKVGRVFPLGLASEGSATVGGFVSTNAGGTQVLRYGTTRALVLGLEAVLPDGRLWNGLHRLRKDNTGYDLKQLLIGAEGTLGVVTAAALKLFPAPAERAVAMVGAGSVEAAVALMDQARTAGEGMLEAFELISASGMELVLRNIPGSREPFASPQPWYILIELAGRGAGELLETLLGEAMEGGLAQDAVLARNQSQAQALWALRENQSAAQKPEGPSWKHDVSVPVSAITRFMARSTAAMNAFSPAGRVVAFGHVGDGNIHFDVLTPMGGDGAAHAAGREEAARIVNAIVADLGGSISAEHGIGVMKAVQALAYKDPADIAAQRAIRAALDPKRIMNPRVLF
ncbi:MAG: FAD/FMN-containing dehydrogenase [Caulobacteraceae bacterium]|nr:FAD/FMN-containing dehydrogenase [Caulobacteraceae bacterium]